MILMFTHMILVFRHDACTQLKLKCDFRTFNWCGPSSCRYMHIFVRTGNNPALDVGVEVQDCDDCGNCGLQGQMSVYLPAGQYWFVIEGFSSNSGVYQVAVSCPVPTPVVVGTLTCGTNVTGNTTGANHTVGMAAPENWFMFTAPQTGIYIFDSCGSSYDTFVLPPSLLGLFLMRRNAVYSCACLCQL